MPDFLSVARQCEWGAAICSRIRAAHHTLKTLLSLIYCVTKFGSRWEEGMWRSAVLTPRRRSSSTFPSQSTLLLGFATCLSPVSSRTISKCSAPGRIVAEYCLLTVETKRLMVRFQGVNSSTSLILAFTANSVEDANTYDPTLPIQGTPWICGRYSMERI